MIKEYIDNTLPNIDYYAAQDGLRGAINSCILASIVSWIGPNSLRPDGTLRGLVDSCVNIYLSRLSEEDRAKRQAAAAGKTYAVGSATSGGNNKSTKRSANDGIRLRGTVTVTCPSPPSGQIESGKIISFCSVHELYKGDKWPYTYNAVTGIYTVYTNSRGKALPYPRRVLEGLQISEQYGQLFFDQLPTVTSADSMTVSDSKRVMRNTSEDVAYRYDENLAGYIKDKHYIEFKTELIGTPPVETTIIVKTIDLSSYMPTVVTETLTIGKMVVIQNVLCVLFFTDHGYATRFGADDDIDLGRMYNCRAGGAYIKGDVLLIDRTTWDVAKPFYTTAATAANQIRFTGIIDMLAGYDGRLILAELSETSHTVTMTYDTAKLFVEAADRVTHRIPVTDDVTKYTESTWYTWLAQEHYDHGYPAKVHVIKEGTKTWSQQYPKLTVSSYELTPGVVGPPSVLPSLASSVTLYQETGTTISRKHENDCFGGYVNCMLYQDVFSEAQPIYIGRCYDAWVQIPFISDNSTIVPGDGPLGNFRADKGKYLNSPLPGEICGFFGVRYDRIVDNSTLALIADIPGDYCKVRSFMKDDPIAHPTSISGAAASTDITLLALNDYVNTTYITNVRANALFNTFSAGPGSTDIDFPSVRHASAGFQNIYAAGLHTYGTRFAVICPKDTPAIKQLLIAGSYEYQVNMYASGEQANTHSPRNMANNACTGLFLAGVLDPDTLVYPVYTVGANWASYYVNNNGITDPAWQPYMANRVDHYTITVSRTDIKMIDAYTFYAPKSMYIRQYDWFQFGNSTYVAGLVWWLLQRECWEFKITGWKGVIADLAVNLNGTERYGAETLLLQYF